MLPFSDHARTFCIVGQFGFLVCALIAGRFALNSRLAILLVAIAGAFGAMFMHIMVDGQAAFVLMVFAPVIYFLAIAGRRRLP